ncbi:MAG: hypothetical protein XD72_0332 [Methanothrix harundinacea]|uniref:Uncharacterized protein n=1 Tax=Methanothrix harundinacea TaxID=301375 RepID=A0A101FVR3_9EURY|nr:MAG: hypothetical protein XD72_0332 [Methanothrix harundinacea]KUK96931.1 MAG: hypothetical protein XE07_0703 [Methanothrix harundinacea]
MHRDLLISRPSSEFFLRGRDEDRMNKTKREAADGIRTHDLLIYRAGCLTNQPLYRAKPRRHRYTRHIAAVPNLSVAIRLSMAGGR